MITNLHRLFSLCGLKFSAILIVMKNPANPIPFKAPSHGLISLFLFACNSSQAAAPIDAAPSIVASAPAPSASAAPARCALPVGQYLVTVKRRDGSCKFVAETTVRYGGDEWAGVVAGGGDVAASPDRCTVTFEIRRQDMVWVEVMHWSLDASSATSIREQSIPGKCTGTYDVTYVRL